MRYILFAPANAPMKNNGTVMNLYNNGFAGGIVAIFLVPVVQSISDRRARARGELSL